MANSRILPVAGLLSQYQTMFFALLIAIPLLAFFLQVAKASSNEDNRPLIHLTPPKGWMNDPNGLFYDKVDKVWHAYYQHYPNKTIWSLPLVWGHATSKDLVDWDHQKIAISPEHSDEGIYSGSIVIDHDNTSGFFNESIHRDQRVVAIYTNNLPDVERQDIAYSLDGGYTFEKYENNPVLDVNSTQFRDPKVFWHERSHQWIMVLAKSQEFKIQIFGSSNLKNWVLHSNFTSGYFGYQYECPGLIEIPIENSNETKWVMFLAINPGAPGGGSVNQYFVGDFDGFEFRADDSSTKLVDMGKDYYALQTFSDVKKENGVLGIAWASNWQYCGKVPTKEWRSSMSLVRNFTLAKVKQNSETERLVLIQNPVLPEESFDVANSLSKRNISMTSETSIEFKSNSSDVGIFEFRLNFRVLSQTYLNDNYTNLDLIIRSNGEKPESVKIGYDPIAQACYFDRGIYTTEFSKNPFFTDKMSTYLEPMKFDEKKSGFYEIHGIVDKNIVELFFNNGSTAMTNTFFMSEGKTPASVELKSNVDDLFVVDSFQINEMKLKVGKSLS